MAKAAVPVLYRQIGWMPCIACSDSKRLKGRMWLGTNRAGVDEFIVCPVCNGTQQVAHYQVIDAMTGKEIDYESYGRDQSEAPIPIEGEKQCPENIH